MQEDEKCKERFKYERGTAVTPANFVGHVAGFDLYSSYPRYNDVLEVEWHKRIVTPAERAVFPSLVARRVIPSAGHFLPREKPEAVSSALLELLKD